jgi:hypothetical protein
MPQNAALESGVTFVARAADRRCILKKVNKIGTERKCELPEVRPLLYRVSTHKEFDFARYRYPAGYLNPNKTGHKPIAHVYSTEYPAIRIGIALFSWQGSRVGTGNLQKKKTRI